MARNVDRGVVTVARGNHSGRMSSRALPHWFSMTQGTQQPILKLQSSMEKNVCGWFRLGWARESTLSDSVHCLIADLVYLYYKFSKLYSTAKKSRKKKKAQYKIGPTSVRSAPAPAFFLSPAGDVQIDELTKYWSLCRCGQECRRKANLDELFYAPGHGNVRGRLGCILADSAVDRCRLPRL